jgi:hypothetical protein
MPFFRRVLLQYQKDRNNKHLVHRVKLDNPSSFLFLDYPDPVGHNESPFNLYGRNKIFGLISGIIARSPPE